MVQVMCTTHMESSRRTWNTLRELDQASSSHCIIPWLDPASAWSVTSASHCRLCFFQHVAL